MGLLNFVGFVIISRMISRCSTLVNGAQEQARHFVGVKFRLNDTR